MLKCLLVALAVSMGTAVAGPQVEVFTDRDHRVTHAQALPLAVVYHLDGLVRAKAALSDGLPTEPEAATAMAKARFAAGIVLQDEMREAGNGLALAHLHYRLDRYPAIVFDGATVIYGVTDLARARDLYREMTR